jgi:hypothetical protein
MSRSVRTLASTCSRVPHGIAETECSPVERDRQAVRRACAPRRDFTLALSLFLGQHGRVFTSGPLPENPPKRDLVVKVLEQVYYKGVEVSSEQAYGAGSPPAGGGLFIPRLKTGAFKPDFMESRLRCRVLYVEGRLSCLKRRANYPSFSTESMFPAGSLNQAMSGP